MRALNVLTGANYWFGFEIFASADSSTLIGEKDVPNLKVKNSTEHGWPWQTAHSDSCDLCGVNPAALKSTLRSLLLFFKGCARKQLSFGAVRDDLALFG